MEVSSFMIIFILLEITEAYASIMPITLLGLLAILNTFPLLHLVADFSKIGAERQQILADWSWRIAANP
jgi:hypothetical protein